MKRSYFSLALAVLCLVAIGADLANAQGGGRGGRGRFGRMGRTTHQLDIAALPEVEAELALTDEQKTAVSDLADEFNDARRDMGGGGGGGGFSEEARAERAKLNADYAAKLNEALEEAQVKRLQEIYVQVNGAAVLSDEAIAMALKLTDEQKTQLTEAQRDQMQAMRDAMQDMEDLSREEQQAAMADLTKARDEALLAVLTDEQKTQFEALKGEALEIDMSQLRGRGGRGGGGRRGGGDGGGRDGGEDATTPPASDEGA